MIYYILRTYLKGDLYFEVKSNDLSEVEEICEEEIKRNVSVQLIKVEQTIIKEAKK